MNTELQLLKIELGKPWYKTTILKMTYASADAIIVIWTGL